MCVVPKDKFEVKGPLKRWQGKADSGNAVWRTFCSECGSPISHEPESAPIVAIKGGTLDTEIKKTLKPVRVFFIYYFFSPRCFPSCWPICGMDLCSWLIQGVGSAQDTEIWTVSKLPFCQEKLAKPFTHMPA